MAGARQTNTFGEALQQMLGDLAKMKTMPDTDMAFVVDVETQIVSKIREPIDGMAASGASQVPGDPSMAGPMAAMGGVGPMAPMPPAMPSGGGATGTRTMPTMPNPDELRRLLTA